MRRRYKIVLWIVSPLLLLVLVVVLWWNVLLDWDAKPYCHKQMTLALRLWSHDKGSTVFPNVEGHSLKSMQAIAEQLVGATNFVFRDYHYVPGLREGDPPELVLFYFNQPTRWRTHIRPSYRWATETWIVVPVDPYDRRFDDEEAAKRTGPGLQQIVAFGEESHSLTTEQFTNRLMATLDFLRTNNRPNWQAVAKEHTEFLQSLPAKP